MSIIHRVKSLFTPPQHTVIECYRARNLSKNSYDWRWRAIAPEDGAILADSGEGYARRIDMLSTVRRLFPDKAAFPVVIENQ